jgi:hypothetical protein
VTVSTLHQRLRDERKLDVSISSFRRWVHAALPDETTRSQVTVLPDDVEPGSEAQIDYGHLGQWTNPRTGKRHQIRALVMARAWDAFTAKPTCYVGNDRHGYWKRQSSGRRSIWHIARAWGADEMGTGKRLHRAAPRSFS